MLTLARNVFLLTTTSLMIGCSYLLPTHKVVYLKYPVRSGDTLYSIGRQFGVNHEKLAQFNRISRPRELAIGSIVKVPLGVGGASQNSSVRASLKTEKPAANPSSLNMVRLTSAKVYIGKLGWPVAGANVNSRFGERWSTFHEGIDLHAPQGAVVRAAHSGVVVYSDNGLRGYGNLIVLKGDYGLMTVYAHNKKNYVGVGARISKGDRIALVGQTGKATGPHLHYETRVKDRSGKNVAVDPLAFYP